MKNMKISLQLLKNKNNIVYALITFFFVILLLGLIALILVKKPQPASHKKSLYKEPTLEEIADFYSAPADSKDKVEVPKKILDSYSSDSEINNKSKEDNIAKDAELIEVPKEILDSFSAPKK